MPIATVNPATGETLKTFDALGAEEIERAPRRSPTAAFRTLPDDGVRRARPDCCDRAADLLDEDQQDIARTMTTEMGKPIAAARAEAAKCAKAMRWYAEHAEELLADEHPAAADVKDSGASRGVRPLPAARRRCSR